jgi:DNA-binding transcriptional LysR family regulator
MTSAGTQALKGNLYVNTMAALVAAAVAGQGLVCVPLPLVMPLLRAGQLAPALPEWVEPKVSVYLHYLNRKNLPARTRVFVEFVLARLREHADLQTPAQALLAPFAATFVR